LLKLYLVGYLNRVPSSRRRARECRRNPEVIGLLEGLAPGYRTTESDIDASYRGLDAQDGQEREVPGGLGREAALPEKTPRRQLYRSEEAHRQRMAVAGPERMRQRTSLVEHPLGTLKRWFGWDHFLVRGFEKVRGAMTRMVLGYNRPRVLNILGWQAFRDYCAQRLSGHGAPGPAARS
jgi:hypothetical protein